jgi:hypothetical protein
MLKILDSNETHQIIKADTKTLAKMIELREDRYDNQISQYDHFEPIDTQHLLDFLDRHTDAKTTTKVSRKVMK